MIFRELDFFKRRAFLLTHPVELQGFEVHVCSKAETKGFSITVIVLHGAIFHAPCMSHQTKYDVERTINAQSFSKISLGVFVSFMVFFGNLHSEASSNDLYNNQTTLNILCGLL